MELLNQNSVSVNLTKQTTGAEVLFSDCCRWQNFGSNLLRVVDSVYTVIHKTKKKRLGQKFCHLRLSVSSTLRGYCPNVFYCKQAKWMFFISICLYVIMLASYGWHTPKPPVDL